MAIGSKCVSCTLFVKCEEIQVVVAELKERSNKIMFRCPVTFKTR